MLHLYTGLATSSRAMLLMRVPCVRVETIDFVLNLPKHLAGKFKGGCINVFIARRGTAR